jgi:lambda family phage portal protein
MVSFTDILAVFSPRAALRRTAYQNALAVQKSGLSERRYEAAARNRLTQGWKATNGSADRELLFDLTTLRDRSSELVRNNPYAASAVGKLTVNLVGKGIVPRAQHKSRALVKKAQAAWHRFADSRVDGFMNFYQIEKLAVRGTIERGDMILLWRAKDGVPNSRVQLLEGDYIDHSQNRALEDGGRIIAGVEFNKDGDRVAYWLFDRHPGDLLGTFEASGGLFGQSSRISAEFVDHIFEPLRAGQTRGVPWLTPVALKLRGQEDLADTIRMKKKVQACLAVFRSLETDSEVPSVGDRKIGEDGRKIDTLRPGMILEGMPGEKFTAVQPSADGDSDTFYRSEMMSIAAALPLPYHLLTGDVSGANYTTLRADTVAFWAALDDKQENLIYPMLCKPAWDRIMQLEALKTGDMRYLQVTAVWSPPVRPWVDPMKDALAEIVQLRAGLKSFVKSCAERGVDWEDQVEELRGVFAAFDLAGLVLDIDPRRVNDAGSAQAMVTATKELTKEAA